MPGADARRRVSVQRCKPYANPNDHGDMPKYLPAVLTQYVLNKLSKKSPRTTSLKTTFRLLFKGSKVEKITGHESVCGRGGVIAVMYETHWAGLFRLSWERQIDLQLSRHEILRCWAGIPNQHRQTNRLHRRMPYGAVQRELFRSNGERFPATGYGCVPRAEWFSRYGATVLPNGTHFR